MTAEIPNVGLALWITISVFLASHFVWTFLSKDSYKTKLEFWHDRYWELRTAHEYLMASNAKLSDDLKQARRVHTRTNSARTYPKKESSVSTKEFSGEELRTLISLCHPDRHGGKDSAVRMTQKLLSMRSGR